MSHQFPRTDPGIPQDIYEAGGRAMSEPQTPTGKRLDAEFAADDPYMTVDILAIEAEAITIGAKAGAAAERMRLTAKARLTHDTNRDAPEHRHPFAHCDHDLCRFLRALLAEPEAER